MSEIKTQLCDADGCGKLRLKDSNHWMHASVGEQGIWVAMMDSFPPREFTTGKLYHFCGLQCVTRWFTSEVAKLREKDA